jgi:D-lactate dehydrogenase
VAVELLDRQSLRSVEDKPGVPKYFSTLGAEVTALLVELQATSAATLQEHISDVSQALEECRPLEVPGFTQDKTQSKRLWDIRKGLFPSLGFARQKGTTIIIEDVAFPLERLADAALDLRHLFERHDFGMRSFLVMLCKAIFILCSAQISIVTQKYEDTRRS